MSFQAWMAKENVRASTARHYAGAIYGVLSQTPLGPVPSEADIEAFDRFAEALRARDDFQSLNETGHRMYRSALAMYRRYVAFLADGVPLEVEERCWFRRGSGKGCTGSGSFGFGRDVVR